MPPTRRLCVYENCPNGQKNRDQGSDLNFFRFPSDAQRRKLWVELAGIPLDTPERDLFLCSKHFDRKFMSVNQRRTMLLGHAVPFSSKPQIKNAETQEVEQIKSENLEISEQTNDNSEILYLKTQYESAEEPNEETQSIVECIDNNDALIDKEHVCKFIYDGKVYVKMRLDYYKREKQAMLNKIQELAQVIDKIKNDVKKINTKL